LNEFFSKAGKEILEIMRNWFERDIEAISSKLKGRR
jgi:hypothetical protein